MLDEKFESRNRSATSASSVSFHDEEEDPVEVTVLDEADQLAEIPETRQSGHRLAGRYNSTSTVHVKDTMAHPDSEGTLVSVARAMRGYVKAGERALRASSQKKANLKYRDSNILGEQSENNEEPAGNENEVGKRRKVTAPGSGSNVTIGDRDVEDVVIRMRKLNNEDKERQLTRPSDSEEFLQEDEKDPDDLDDTISLDGGVELPSVPVEPVSHHEQQQHSSKTDPTNFTSFFNKLSPFNKLLRPKNSESSKKETQARPLPSTREIFRFMKNIYTTAQCSVDCTIIALIYVERFLKTSGIHLSIMNWKSIIMTAMLLASKVWDDLSMVNIDFSIFLPYSLAQINTWERQFLAGMKYNVRVSIAQYADSYFEARLATAQRRFRRAKRERQQKQVQIIQEAVSKGDDSKVKELLKKTSTSSSGSSRRRGFSEDDEEFQLPEVPINLEQAKKLEIVSSTMEKRLLEMKALMGTAKDKKKDSKTGRRAVSEQFFVRQVPESPRFVID